VPARARRTITVLAISLLSLGLTASPAIASTNTNYVSLGDSFVAGPLIPNQTTDPVGCLRSDHNYPSLVAKKLGVDKFTDVSCSGAVTDDMFSPQSVPLGSNPAQLDAVNADTTLVTVGISGNDIGFADILINCVAKGAVNPFGSPCKDQYTKNGGDELRDRIAQARGKVDKVLDGIADRAPNARVVVTGYLPILPESKGCWPKVTLGERDVPYLDGVEQALNGMLSDAAGAHDAAYADNTQRGHDICADRDDRWVEGIIPTRPAAPVHPNASGMEVMAAAVADQLS
jgi:lysophospholipase L1-like esterase